MTRIYLDHYMYFRYCSLLFIFIYLLFVCLFVKTDRQHCATFTVICNFYLKYKKVRYALFFFYSA